MKKRVLDYITVHPHSSAVAVAQSLNLPGLDALRLIHELERECYLKMDTPVPLSPDNKHNSNYYTATGKKYIENKDET